MHPISGVLNWLLELVGIEGLTWLSSTKTALLSVVLIDTWIYMPFAALILLSGLQAVPVELLEAAKMDGGPPGLIFSCICTFHGYHLTYY